MQLTWKTSNKYKPEIILKKIEDSRNIDESAQISFSSFELEQNLSVLKNMVDFPIEIPEIERSKSIWQAVSMEKGQFSAPKILKKINMYFSDIEKLESKDYCLLSSISLAKDLLPNRVTIHGVRLSFFVGSFPKKFKTRFEFLSELGIFKSPNPETYTKIIARNKEKTPFIAAYKAIDSIDYFRAIACLHANPLMQSRSNDRYPINRIRLGEFHSLHESNGSIPTRTYWFEPDFVEEKVFSAKDSDKMKNSIMKWIMQIDRVSYRKVLIESLQRYVRALDEKDPYTALIKVWNALEYLCCGEYAKYNIIVSRVANIFREKDYHIQVLEHLRDVRNVSVHSGNQVDSARQDCYLIQYYYKELVKFLVGNYKSFKTIDDAYEFLDLPNDVGVLNDKKKKLEKAIHYHK